MYRAFFGFREKPFNLTPDPKFLYLNASYREALAALHYGIAERKGFVALVGEAGTGKTTLLRRLLSELGPETRSVLVLNPAVAFDELLVFILTDLGRPPAPGTPKLELLEALNAELLDTLARGGNVVVLIDEAQDLGMTVLEELRLLSNLETAKEKILQFVLAGQPELDTMLERTELRQLRQRIAVFSRLRPLGRREVKAYVEARIAAAGGRAGDLFSRAALYRLWRFSRGVPRLVNVAGDNALVTAYAAGQRRVGWRTMGDAVRDLRPGRKSRFRLAPARLATIGLAAMIGIGVGVAVSRLSADPNGAARPAHPHVATVTVPQAEPVAPEPVPVPAPAAPDAAAPAVDAGAASVPAEPVPRPADPVAAAPEDAHQRTDAGPAGEPANDGAAVASTSRNDAVPAAEVASRRAPVEADAAPPPSPSVSISVERGDTLTHIVRRYYGRKSPDLVAAVQRANPEIADPDVVVPGQSVVLPVDPLRTGEALLQIERDSDAPPRNDAGGGDR
jgi:general secretion pathway protein A